jgi:hypothetical protein
MTRKYLAASAIEAHRIVQFDSSPDAVVVADTPAARSIGITTDLSAAQGGEVEVTFAGEALVRAAGAIARGELVTASEGGCANACAPSAGGRAQSIGLALADGAAGDLIPILVSRSQVTSPAGKQAA